MKYLIVFLCLCFASVANAQDCQNLKSSGDDTPVTYLRYKCEGKKALKNKQYEKAVNEFKAALAVPINDAPNYDLNIELAEALCKLGRKEEAKNIFKEYKCMVAVDLGEIECQDKDGKPNPKLTKECAETVCHPGSGLTDEGMDDIKKRRIKMLKIEKECN